MEAGLNQGLALRLKNPSLIQLLHFFSKVSDGLWAGDWDENMYFSEVIL